MADNEDLKTLIEMGFDEGKSKKALSLNSNLQDAMEWLLLHSNDPDVETKQTESSHSLTLKLNTENLSATSNVDKIDEIEEKKGETNVGSDHEETTSANESQAQANSLKCDECGKLLKDADAATAHAYKTKHSSFSESNESIKPKTKEEIEEQKRILAEKLVKLRQERQEKEKQEEIEREKQRRTQGRQINEIRQKVHEDELKRIAEERRREKLAAEAQKQKIREQIAQDREKHKKPQETTVTQPAQVTQITQEKRSYDDCKIQVRLTDGKVMVQTFKAKEQLAAVRLWVQLNRTDDHAEFTLLQTFPRKQFNDDDMMQTLENLGLVPASSLVVQRRI